MPTGNGSDQSVTIDTWRLTLQTLILAAHQAPEIQQMYSLNLPVSQLRTKVRQEFERHRYVNKLPVVDMLLFQSHSEFQVCHTSDRHQENSCWEAGEWGQRDKTCEQEQIPCADADAARQETLNYWKQIPHVMKYFRETENPTARLPAGFMQGFLEVGIVSSNELQDG